MKAWILKNHIKVHNGEKYHKKCENKNSKNTITKPNNNPMKNFTLGRKKLSILKDLNSKCNDKGNPQILSQISDCDLDNVFSKPQRNLPRGKENVIPGPEND